MAVLDTDEAVQDAPQRIDGRAKIMGRGTYTADLTDATLRPYLHAGETAKSMLYAVTVPSTIARGMVTAIDATMAFAVDGVVAVLTHENATKLHAVKSLVSSEQTKFLPLQSAEVHYHGQPLAVVLARSFETATQAAALVRIRYTQKPGVTEFLPSHEASKPVKKVGAGDKGHVECGNPEQAYKVSAARVDGTYNLSPAHHNAMEPAATVAHWHPEDGETNRLTVITTTQFAYGEAIMLAEAFEIGHKDKILRIVSQVMANIEYDCRVRVVAPLIGGAFGSKNGLNITVLAVMAARATGHPVKLVLSRQQTFSQMPYRGGLQIRVRLGSDAEGRLQSFLQEAILQSAETASFLEPAGEIATHLYAVPNMLVDHRSITLDTNSPGWMRAPGVAPGQFAMECAMDDLADELGMDPLQLRLLNYAEQDPESGKQWSSKALRECYAVAADRFGWHRRKQRSDECEGTERIGYGMATAAYPTNQFPSVARVTFHADGSVLAQSATQEIGQGVITVLSQVTAEALGLPLERVRLEIGDTTLPFGVFTGGSATSLSVGSALQEAVRKLGYELARLARVDKASPLYGCALKDIVFVGGMIRHRVEDERREDARVLLNRNGRSLMAAKGVAGRLFGRSKLARYAFGAQFVRVAVCEVTGRVRVTHMTSAFAAGRILNVRTARSQLLGGMVWGIGHALLEESVRERHSGGWLNSNLAEAHVPVNADVPVLDVLIVEEDDSRGSALGAKGLGEIGIVGVAGAISNAIFNATGKRLRQLPMTADDLLNN